MHDSSTVLDDRAPGAPGDARRRALRRALAAGPERLRIVAEDVLGAETRIDWVCVGPEGGILLVLQAEAGRDLELVARGLAQRAWVEARLPDWAKLAPDLGLRPEAGAAVLLLCPDFGVEARAAAASADSRRMRLATCHFEHEGAEVRAWIAPVARAAPHPVAAPGPAIVGPEPLPEFRTGLSDADLGVSADERSAFESATPRETIPTIRSG